MKPSVNAIWFNRFISRLTVIVSKFSSIYSTSSPYLYNRVRELATARSTVQSVHRLSIISNAALNVLNFVFPSRSASNCRIT